MRWARAGIVGAAVLLALHLLVLAGVDLGHAHPLASALTLDHQQDHQAPAVDRPGRGPATSVACLAMLAGLLVAHATRPAAWRRRHPPAVTPPAAPVPTPPTPPPIALGVSRS